MLSTTQREQIQSLLKAGMPIREISRTVKVSRNAVRRLQRTRDRHPEDETPHLLKQHGPLIKEVFQTCKGNGVRVHEVLKTTYGLEIPYSTLTRLLRAAHLREPPAPVGTYHFQPGEEMQFDTSPHRVTLGDQQITLQCAALVAAYSRRLHVAYFTRFTRFEAKWFLTDALAAMGGSHRRCLIDNTCVVLASGSGENAVIAPTMADFARAYGFEFRAHRINNPQRKGRVERPFHYIEHNFLAGRSFQDLEDLNRQVEDWCLEVANRRHMRVLGMSPEAAFVHEAPALRPLPRVTPPVCEAEFRTVDSAGFVTLERNRYSVPWTLIGKNVEVIKSPKSIAVYFSRKKVAEHARVLLGVGRRVSLKEHETRRLETKRKDVISPDEQALANVSPVLDAYMADLKKRVRGRGVNVFRNLLRLKRTYTEEAFLQAVAHAHGYGLYDIQRLEKLILERVAGDYFHLDLTEVD